MGSRKYQSRDPNANSRSQKGATASRILEKLRLPCKLPEVKHLHRSVPSLELCGREEERRLPPLNGRMIPAMQPEGVSTYQMPVKVAVESLGY